MSFKITVIPRTTQKSIRFPNEIIETVEEIIKGTDCTFSFFVIKAVEKALKELEN